MFAIYFLAFWLVQLSSALEGTNQDHADHTGAPGTQGLEDIFSHVVQDVTGAKVSLDQYRGKVILFVNVASECGFTDRHYKGLKKIKEVLGHTDKFEILAFPSNEFGGQEPQDNAHIYKFVKEKYSVNFPIFAKTLVTGENALPVWKYLTLKSGNEPTWNFWKYLVGPEGEVLGSWGPWSDIDEIYPDVKATIDSLMGKQPAGIYGPRRPGFDKDKPAPSQDGVIGPPKDSKSGPTPHQSRPGPANTHPHMDL